MGLTAILLAEREREERKRQPPPPDPPLPLDQQLKASKNAIVRLESELTAARKRIAQLEADLADAPAAPMPLAAEPTANDEAKPETVESRPRRRR